MKISELKVGSSCDITLVVRNATPKTTKAGKPYLLLEFFDGNDTIMGNYWDWASGKVPEPNAILDVTGQVTEWQGKKQLTVKALVTNTTKVINDFIPTAGVDLAEIYKEAYVMLGDVKDDFLRSLSMAIFDELKVNWLQVPGAVSVHHAYLGGTLIHSLSVARIAKAIASCVPMANADLCIVGAMLHDLGKLYTYKLNGATIEYTDVGQLYEHSFIGAEFVGNFADNISGIESPVNEHKMHMLRHIILSHHGKLEYGAAVPPKSVEAIIVSAADGIDASTEQIRAAAVKAPEGSMWTNRIFTLNNSACLTPEYVAGVLYDN